MINFVKEFGNIIHEQFFYAQNGNVVRLIEKDEQAKGNYVELQSANIQTFVLELDKRKIIQETRNSQERNITSDIHILLKDGQEGLKKACDYLIFCQQQGNLFMLMIELKSDRPEGWLKQTYAGENVAKYLLGMLENYKDYCLVEKVNFRHILFTTKDADSAKGRNRGKIKEMQQVKYEQHPKFSFLFCRKSCNLPYELGVFLQ